MTGDRVPRVQDAETWFAHADPACRGPVYFEIAGGWCCQCGRGPLAPYFFAGAAATVIPAGSQGTYLRWPPGQRWPGF